MKKQNHILLVTTALLLSSASLSGCGSTFEGIKTDLGEIGSSVSGAIGSTFDSDKNAAPAQSNNEDTAENTDVPKNILPQKILSKKKFNTNSRIADTEPQTQAQPIEQPKPQEDKKSVALYKSGECPPITLDPQLKQLVEFQDMENPSKKTEVSHIKLANYDSDCAKDGDYISMRLDLNFEGGLGPKAKRKKNDQPFFAYPYFIAVTDGNDNELAREIFAASVTYEKKQENIALTETIRQRLPLNDDGSTPDYKVKIGFQLTPEQLTYNVQN